VQLGGSGAYWAMLWPRRGVGDVLSGWPHGSRRAALAMPGRRFLFGIGCHGSVPPLWHIPLRSSWSLGGVEVTGVGQAAW
jgi:hypothetical protein